MRKKVRIAVIPAAGFGTRFLPATKELPKEMLPIIDIPTIQYLVNEAIESGVEEVIIVTSRDKPAIESYFSKNEKLDLFLRNRGNSALADSLLFPAKNAKITFVYQDKPLGLGHAIYCVKDYVKKQPFGVILGDDIVDNPRGKTALKQLITAYQKTESTIIGVQSVSDQDISKYGSISPDLEGRLGAINRIIEKPKAEEAPSLLASLGRYLLTHDIFEALENTPAGKNGELQLTDAFNTLLGAGKPVYALNFKGNHFDIGDKAQYVNAIVYFAHKRSDIAPYLKKKGK